MTGSWIDDFLNWMNSCHSKECQAATGSAIGIPAQSGSGETDEEVGGWFHGGNGDYGGETFKPIDPITGRAVPYGQNQPLIFGVSVGTWMVVGFAAVIVKAAVGFDGGRR